MGGLRPGSSEPDRPIHVVDQIGQSDLHPGSGQANRAHHERHRPFLPTENVLDRGADLRHLAVGPGDVPRLLLAQRLLMMDAGAKAVGRKVCLVGLRAVSPVGPDIAGGVGLREETGQMRPVVAGCVGSGPGLDQPRGSDRCRHGSCN